LTSASRCSPPRRSAPRRSTRTSGSRPSPPDFDEPLDDLPGAPGTRLVAFLGSTIGNLLPARRAEFLSALRERLAPGDTLLIGADLVKDPDRLVRAYDDAAGVTAAFNRNVIAVLATELGVDLDPEDFEHLAIWNADDERIEMRLRARRDIDVVLDGGVLAAHAVARRAPADRDQREVQDPRAAGRARRGRLAPGRAWTDAAGDYSLLLAAVPAVPAGTPGRPGAPAAVVTRTRG
jgi:L-histidine N-alpha-methyltransferase